LLCNKCGNRRDDCHCAEFVPPGDVDEYTRPWSPAPGRLLAWVPILFLDVDGVLNGHEKLESGYCGVCQRRAALLNQILAAVPQAKIVISSAWRYMILRGAMTLGGFESLLLTHGICCQGRLAGHTIADEESVAADEHHRPPFDSEMWKQLGLKWRASQILQFVQENKVNRFAVLDDLPLDVPNLLATDSRVGLTESHVRHAIKLLRGDNSG
jgi:hypothetical protein